MTSLKVSPESTSPITLLVAASLNFTEAFVRTLGPPQPKPKPGPKPIPKPKPNPGPNAAASRSDAGIHITATSIARNALAIRLSMLFFFTVFVLLILSPCAVGFSLLFNVALLMLFNDKFLKSPFH